MEVKKLTLNAIEGTKIVGILDKMVSGEITNAAVSADGMVIASSQPLYLSEIETVSTTMFVVASKIAEDALANTEKVIEKIVITANSEVVGGLNITIQRAGPNAFIIVESKGILPGSQLGYISGNGKVGGTFARINEAAEEIAKVMAET